MANFVNPEELTYFIENIQPFEIVDIGSIKWLDAHGIIVRLSQQATLEAAEHREEEVKELLILHDKLKILIHEAYCTNLWKTRVLPHLLDIDPNPKATFLIYAVFYHEGAIISLLDVALYHESGCEALKDAAIDLIDYCALGVAQLIGLTSVGHHENRHADVGESTLTELERQKRDFIYKIGLRCISILNYLADNVKALHFNAGRRMLVTHDVPWLMADVLNIRPWQRHMGKSLERFIDEKWVRVEDDDETTKITKYEAQAWFCLRQLLLNNELMQNYEITEEKCRHLSDLQGLLHESVLDQLPPLIDLKHYLCRLSLEGSNGGARSNEKSKKNLILEEVPEIREQLIGETEKSGGFIGIAQHQEDTFLCSKNDQIFRMAQSLNASYNADLLAEWEEKTEKEVQRNNPKGMNQTNENTDGKASKCSNCSNDAVKKCSQCKRAFYCSRECQLKDWPNHKNTCLKV